MRTRYPTVWARTFVFLLLFILWVLAESVEAGPWMQSEGDGVLATGIVYSRADRFFRQDGDRILYNNPREEGLYSLYYEYGYDYPTTVLTSLWGTNDMRKEEEGTPSAGVFHPIAGIKFGLRKRVNRFRDGRTWQLTATIPVSIEEGVAKEYALDTGLFFYCFPTRMANCFLGFGAGESVSLGRAERMAMKGGPMGNGPNRFLVPVGR